MHYHLDIGGGCSILSSSELVAWPVILRRCPGPHRSGMTPTNVSNSTIRQDRAASRHSVIPPAVSGEVNGPSWAKYFGWLTLANPGNATVLDPSLTPAPRSIESKAVSDRRVEATPLSLKGRRSAPR